MCLARSGLNRYLRSGHHRAGPSRVVRSHAEPVFRRLSTRIGGQRNTAVALCPSAAKIVVAEFLHCTPFLSRDLHPDVSMSAGLNLEGGPPHLVAEWMGTHFAFTTDDASRGTETRIDVLNDRAQVNHEQGSNLPQMSTPDRKV